MRWSCEAPGRWYASHGAWVFRARRCADDGRWELLASNGDVWVGYYDTLAAVKAAAEALVGRGAS